MDTQEAIRNLARHLAHEHAPQGCQDIEDIDAEFFETVLVESGLADLLNAGQAMRDCNYINLSNSRDWDVAWAKFNQATGAGAKGRKGNES
jgi:hypothetical protein